MMHTEKPSFPKEKLLKSIEQLDPINDPRYSKCNDICIARLFSDIFRDYCRYNTTRKEWCVYNGIIWETDTGAMETEASAKNFADALMIYALGKAPSNSYFKEYILKLGDRRKRVTMLQDARDFNYISDENFDRHTALLNTKNAVIDLTDFTASLHNPSLLFSKCADVNYKPEIHSEDWDKFILEVMCGDKEKVHYLQKLFGYSLTAESNREEFYILYGSTTRNGKSTCLETIGKMLGSYSLNMDVSSLALMKRDSRQASGDIARLKDARFVTAAEPPKKMLLNVQLLKTLTGRDTITARHLMEREIQFIPVFKLFMNTNYLPIVSDPTLFNSERVRVISFDRHFEPEEQDKGLKDRLLSPDNLSGILNWCLDGLRTYRDEGLTPPASVNTATKAYKEDSDKIQLFFKEVMIPSKNNSSAKAVYNAFNNWCKENGFGVDSKKSFLNELRERQLLSDSGLVNNMCIRNVIKGYDIDESVTSSFESIGFSPFHDSSPM